MNPPYIATIGRIEDGILPGISLEHYRNDYHLPLNEQSPLTPSHSSPGDPPDYMSNPHWWRYRDKNCCHPKNIWHCCCHRETYWSSAELNTDRSWYDCRGTGFLRCLLLTLMWSCVWPCVGIGFLVLLLYFLCCVCCGCVHS